MWAVLLFLLGFRVVGLVILNIFFFVSGFSGEIVLSWLFWRFWIFEEVREREVKRVIVS